MFLTEQSIIYRCIIFISLGVIIFINSWIFHVSIALLYSHICWTNTTKKSASSNVRHFFIVSNFFERIFDFVEKRIRKVWMFMASLVIAGSTRHPLEPSLVITGLIRHPLLFSGDPASSAGWQALCISIPYCTLYNKYFWFELMR